MHVSISPLTGINGPLLLVQILPNISETVGLLNFKMSIVDLVIDSSPSYESTHGAHVFGSKFLYTQNLVAG